MQRRLRIGREFGFLLNSNLERRPRSLQLFPVHVAAISLHTMKPEAVTTLPGSPFQMLWPDEMAFIAAAAGAGNDDHQMEVGVEETEEPATKKQRSHPESQHTYKAYTVAADIVQTGHWCGRCGGKERSHSSSDLNEIVSVHCVKKFRINVLTHSPVWRPLLLCGRPSTLIKPSGFSVTSDEGCHLECGQDVFPMRDTHQTPQPCLHDFYLERCGKTLIVAKTHPHMGGHLQWNQSQGTRKRRHDRSFALHQSEPVVAPLAASHSAAQVQDLGLLLTPLRQGLVQLVLGILHRYLQLITVLSQLPQLSLTSRPCLFGYASVTTTVKHVPFFFS